MMRGRQLHIEAAALLARPPFEARLARDDSGIAAIEYALLASLIAVAIVGAVTNLGAEVGIHWNGIASAV